MPHCGPRLARRPARSPLASDASAPGLPAAWRGRQEDQQPLLARPLPSRCGAEAPAVGAAHANVHSSLRLARRPGLRCTPLNAPRHLPHTAAALRQRRQSARRPPAQQRRQRRQGAATGREPRSSDAKGESAAAATAATTASTAPAARRAPATAPGAAAAAASGRLTAVAVADQARRRRVSGGRSAHANALHCCRSLEAKKVFAKATYLTPPHTHTHINVTQI